MLAPAAAGAGGLTPSAWRLSSPGAVPPPVIGSITPGSCLHTTSRTHERMLVCAACGTELLNMSLVGPGATSTPGPSASVVQAPVRRAPRGAGSGGGGGGGGGGGAGSATAHAMRDALLAAFEDTRVMFPEAAAAPTLELLRSFSMPVARPDGSFAAPFNLHDRGVDITRVVLITFGFVLADPAFAAFTPLVTTSALLVREGLFAPNGGARAHIAAYIKFISRYPSLAASRGIVSTVNDAAPAALFDAMLYFLLGKAALWDVRKRSLVQVPAIQSATAPDVYKSLRTVAQRHGLWDAIARGAAYRAFFGVAAVKEVAMIGICAIVLESYGYARADIVSKTGVGASTLATQLGHLGEAGIVTEVRVAALGHV